MRKYALKTTAPPRKGLVDCDRDLSDEQRAVALCKRRPTLVIAFEWLAADRDGTVTATFRCDGTPAAAFHLLRGSLQFAFEACGTVGQVGVPQLVESTAFGAIVRYSVNWA